MSGATLSVAKNILIVEDNELNLKLFKDLLEAHGFTIWESREGDAALRLLDEMTPDLILLDIQLPNRSGLEIIQEIRSNKAKDSIPIIAVTAHALRPEEEKIISANCQAYIAKPISIMSFIQVIKDSLFIK